MSIHPTAIIDRKAQIDSTVEIGPYCVVDADVQIASGCRLYNNVYITGWTRIAENCELYPGVSVGHAPQDIKYAGQRTYCRIGRGTILREYVTVHRGTEPDSETVVGEDCFILAGTHVGHNCHVGNGVTLINNTLLAGHVTIENRATLGGMAGIHQFVRIGELAMVAGCARVVMDIIPFALVDVDGRIAGINRIGLRRAEMPKEHILEIREAYRTLFSRGLSFREAVERLADVVKNPPGLRLLEFLQSESRKGIAGRPRSRHGNAASSG